MPEHEPRRLRLTRPFEELLGLFLALAAINTRESNAEDQVEVLLTIDENLEALRSAMEESGFKVEGLKQALARQPDEQEPPLV